jgi:hypothetical protein
MNSNNKKSNNKNNNKIKILKRNIKIQIKGF